MKVADTVMAAMKRWHAQPFVAAILVFGALAGARAEPVHPASDQTVVETLATQLGDRQAQRRLRQALAKSPRDAGLAVEVAKGHLELARTQGDARYAGLALGALSAWPQAGSSVPVEVLMMRATVAQYLHDFDGAAALLDRVTQRSPTHAQAWLTLATIRRVQGRYAESDAACKRVGESGQALHAGACLAENLSLTGQNDAARSRLQQLMTSPAVMGPDGAAIRQWLLTTLAELEERAGQPEAARAAWARAQALGASPYVLTAHADFLLQQQQPAEALAVLQGQDKTDAVLLRLSIAAHRLGRPQAKAWSHEMQARLQAAASRPGSGLVHAREQARFALEVLGQPEKALSLARQNLAHQRETADWLLMAQATQAQAGDKARRNALAELSRLQQSTGIVDARLANL